MRHLLTLLLWPVLSLADCNIELDEIKLTVNRTLQPLIEKDNSEITKDEFAHAQAEISSLISKIESCADYHDNYEVENYNYTRWGEKSSKFRSYALWLTSVDMQLEAAVNSFDYWIFRFWVFDYDMWEKVALEFDAREI